MHGATSLNTTRTTVGPNSAAPRSIDNVALRALTTSPADNAVVQRANTYFVPPRPSSRASPSYEHVVVVPLLSVSASVAS
ncbi:MAG: hypothetical protein DI536_31555 [Archangium gephyra]|uniref:Uncharacterized protein n=1 Tax=Archangium gephyra TaxID=48 RepID=A0A2W5SRD8_9BACT|nr:MAG: hypothetical protein DI536_31555 [Archangium gephyra]